jgi:hypothetical protein
MDSKHQNISSAHDKQPSDSFVVKGRILQPNGTPFIGGLVRAFDHDLRQEQPLGQDTRTAEDGSYEIRYSRDQFSRPKKNRADLIVRVFDQKGEKLLAASPLIFKAQPVETVDLVVGRGDYKGPSEYDQLLEELEPLLVNVKVEGTRSPAIFHKLADLKEDEHQQEITFLAREMGVERKLIAFLVLAARLSIETKLVPKVFYGLFRQGLSPHLPTLLAQKMVILRRTMEAAVRRNLIPEFDNKQELEQILDCFKELRIQHTLEEPDQPGKVSLGDLLETALPQNRGKQETFLKRYREHQDQEPPEPIEHFWQALRQTEEFKDDIDTLQFTLQAGTLTQNHLPLVQELYNLRREGKLQTPRDWAKLDVEVWTKLIRKQRADGQPIGFPPDVPGKDDTEKTKNYATMMARFIEDAFPTPVIAHHIEQENRPEQADLVQFFRTNQAFEFRKISVDAYLERHGSSALTGLQNPAAATRTLKGMQRLFKVTPRYSELRMLQDAGLASAHDITSLGKKTFAELYGGTLGGTERALELYNRACQTEAMAMMLCANYSQNFVRTDVAAIAPAHPHAGAMDSEELHELGIAVPTWEKLFGSLDLCDCEHCRSVYSPAAYLVDILAFLKKLRANTAGQTPLDILYERRPDLGTLDLSCENTNTILPYVDLVNELLENAIAPLRPFDPFEIAADLKEDLDNRSLSPALQVSFDPNLSVGATIVVLNPGREWRILDTSYAYSVLDEDPADDTLQVVARGWQTYASTEELRANPQYTNPDAYDRLAEAVYPWHLPFDRWTTEARTYLEHLGVNRHNLMVAFQSQGMTPTPDENAIASEYMGLTPVEWQILTGTYPTGYSPARAWQYWGYPRTPAPSHWIEDLSQVSTFLQTSGLTYLELLELLSTRFINPDGSLRIVSTDHEDLSTCDLAKLRIDNLDLYVLDRIHRFVRLWRQLGWSMVELDKAIDTLKPIDRTVEELNAEDWADLLRRLSHIQRLKADLKVPVVTMLSWWTLIDTTEYIQQGKPPSPSLYDELFQNKAVFSSPDDVQLFRLNDARDQLQETGNISQTIPALCAALGISAAVLSLLTAGLPELVEDETTADQLNLENLSYLFRVVSLSKALKLSVQDFLTVRALAGTSPLLDAIRITATTPGDERVYPEGTLQWIETLDKIRASGFKIGEVAYLLRCEEDKIPGSIAHSEDTVALFLSDLRDGLKAIADEQIITADLTGDLTRQKLLLLNWDPSLVEDVIAVLNNSKIFSVTPPDPFPIDLPLPLEDLPDVLTADEKAALRRKLSLKISDGGNTLQFQGVMTENERVALLSLSSEAGYETAIEDLFQAPREFVITRMKAFDPTVSVPLAVLPPAVVFPEDLKHRISYDAISQELRYLGVMTADERDSLLAVPGDGTYQGAIDDLFAESNSPLDPEDENVFLVLDDAVALFNEPAAKQVPERFAYVLEKVVPHLRTTLSRNLIKQMLSDTLDLEAAITSQLLTQWVNATTDSSQKAIADFLDGVFVASQSKLTAAAFREQFLTFERLQKIAAAIAKFDVSAEELAWIFENGPELGWLNLAQLPVQTDEPDAPFTDWTRLIDGLQVFDQLPSSETTLFDLFDLIQSFEAIDGNAKETFLSTLCEATGWDLADMEILVGQKDDLSDTGLLDLIFPDDFQTEKALLVLIPCFKLIRRLGVSAREVSTWVQPEISYENARTIKQAVKAKYDNTQWLELAKPLRDVLREKQRASLVAYLAHHADLWLSADQIEALQAAGQRPDANKLYAHFLLDVEMSPCMMTSRIKQACGSVQLFIQRGLMGLEEGVSIGEETAEKWKWMKNYRVWEANRKVFLYPENWIEPELRDDKTPFFKDLENELQQNEVNEDTVESAFSKYLEKLDTVARLEICGMYHQLEVGQNILHVFGRTEGAAPVYYYRRGVDSSYWTAWEEVTVDIDSDHLIPVVHLGRVKLFWPIFTEKQEEEYGSDADPKKYWEIQLAWSEYKNGKWTAKKISSETEKLVEKVYAHFPKDSYTFKALQWGHNLAILCLRSGEEELEPPTYVGVFAFSGCRDSILTQGILDIAYDDEANYSGIFHKQIPYPLINQNTTPKYEKIVEWLNLLAPDRSEIQNMVFVEEASYREESDDSLNLTPDYYLGTKVPTLNKTPGTFELLYQHQLHWYQYQLLNWVQQHPDMAHILYFLLHFPAFQFLRIPSSFFYQDDFRTFFVIPVTLPLMRLVFEEDQVSLEYLGWLPRNYGAEALPISTADDDLSSAGNGTNQPISSLSYSIWKDEHMSRYLFRVFYHPYLCRFIEVFNRHGIDGLLQRNIQLLSDDFFEAEYEPTEAVVPLYPRDEVDFSYDGAYSQYNWELFFHSPLLIAERLSSNQRFAEAQRWFHYIFDPTNTSDDAVPKRYWRTRPFYEATDEQYQAEQIRTLLRTLADESTEPGVRDRLEKQVRQWRRNPFNPHLIARLRTTAFQKAVVIKYIDNLIAWGDYLFRQDTIESINEATQLYILAAEILGPRPQKIPARSTPPTRTVDYLVLNQDLDAFSNLLEDALPPAYSASSVTDTEGSVPVSLGKVLYFCVPKNDKLLEYWDTVEDRLFKIRHCMNIEGIVRELPLFQPPIEPGLLVKAVAAGIDISSVLNDMNAPLPHYRCQVMLQKALELCNDVKTLGGSLLSALEKRDAETLALLRSSHEIALLDAVRVIKESQVDEAKETLESTKKSRELVRLRKKYYGRLLTSSPTLTVGGGEGSDDAGITTKPLYPMNEFELLHLSLSGTSLAVQAGQAATDLAAGILHLIPNTEIGAPTTAGVTYGGSNIAQGIQAFGSSLGVFASMLNAGASLAATMGSYKRRAEEWNFQKQLAVRAI